MTNRHLISRIRKLERDLADKPPDPQTMLRLIEDSTKRVREAFITGTKVAQPHNEQETQQIEAYLHSLNKGVDMNSDRERNKMLQFGARGRTT